MASISAIILSGGRATRMNGVDKGLVLLKQKPLIQHVIERLAPQVDEILINANRKITHYQTFGYTVLKDEVEDFLGPLAGFSLGLQHAEHDYLLTVPCDSPLLPLDLAHRLMLALLEHKAEIAVASSDDNTHPVFCLCKKNVLPSLTAYLQQGERRVSAWQKSLNYIEVDFSDCSDAFVNLNTFEDLAALELKLNNTQNQK
ncbi:molybdenum cofactor guanylyltransferase MobA [Methylotenera sp.]|uniref:molybdenum cofactor guanylyltransferase MobA n=2 Tax=Methylotenera sp. TaxID=2051956 RepID=UPI00272FCA76|nr:molybdenum cofactor guanylyltransferase MobA [Methylotenera sp.]MDP1521837.1 molybdenum cofactor guanylyltransferase MobA [Methylotenera sp.]MDP2070703.1 molybdenum cofactor guanylyltransferase MobA [Methylotenera sp.]MDP2231435.1 molybdenum cofactor guanylyltransferase MobA [Methylotenera sp.]MDP3004816.1 molybdenum cofactor guanylyltransferase MobA [Methylotenera sp.]MDP3140826.1 molybdenum cofactor guanylyltransferase MobA [Methylotenera sp.]